MKLLEETFPKTPEGKKLLEKVKRALARMSGRDANRDRIYPRAPRGLQPGRDLLKSSYVAIWRRCTLEYSPREAGASVKAGKIRIGPFFLKPRFRVLDIQKVILHEYLHEAIDISWRKAHHGQIDQIIQYNLGWPGPPNPAEGMTH